MTGLKRTPRSRGGFTLVELIVVLWFWACWRPLPSRR